jgi:hypothetical protein
MTFSINQEPYNLCCIFEEEHPFTNVMIWSWHGIQEVWQATLGVQEIQNFGVVQVD